MILLGNYGCLFGESNWSFKCHGTWAHYHCGRTAFSCCYLYASSSAFVTFRQIHFVYVFDLCAITARDNNNKKYTRTSQYPPALDTRRQKKQQKYTIYGNCRKLGDIYTKLVYFPIHMIPNKWPSHRINLLYMFGFNITNRCQFHRCINSKWLYCFGYDGKKYRRHNGKRWGCLFFQFMQSIRIANCSPCTRVSLFLDCIFYLYTCLFAQTFVVATAPPFVVGARLCNGEAIYFRFFDFSPKSTTEQYHFDRVSRLCQQVKNSYFRSSHVSSKVCGSCLLLARWCASKTFRLS